MLGIIAYVIAAAAALWVGMMLFAFGGLIFVLLAAVLAVLKLIDLIALSWWWVTLPLWAAVGGALVKMRAAARDSRF